LAMQDDDDGRSDDDGASESLDRFMHRPTLTVRMLHQCMIFALFYCGLMYTGHSDVSC
jgi:hypothetical protein